MSGPLLWLQSCLNRTADDRQHDGEFNSHISVFHCMDVCVCLKSLPGSLDLSFPVPLVPLTEANEDAMENRSFHRLLRKLGLRPPANEQVCVCVSYNPIIFIIYI